MENVARFDALSAFAICKEQRTLPRMCRGGDAKKVTAIEGKSSAMEISAHIRYVLRSVQEEYYEENNFSYFTSLPGCHLQALLLHIG